MPYFAQLHEEKTSLFYQKLWSEFESIKVYDTHEHYQFPTYWNQQLEKTGSLTPQILGGSYVYNFPTALDYNAWASAAHDYQFTGYFRSFLWGIEELYGIEPPATPAYFELLETQLKEIYCVDDGGLGHMKDIIENRMHVDHTLANIGIDEHLQFRNMIPGMDAVAGIGDLLESIFVPRKNHPNLGFIYRFAVEWLHKDLADIQILDNYCEIITKLLEYVHESGNYKGFKIAVAYKRPLLFPEPPDNKAEIASLFNQPVKVESDLWRFGDYILHFMLDWIGMHWKIPIQFHTGLARIYDNGSNAINLSYLFQKYQDLHFDLFHGNYPFNNLAGMLHQIPNISADLCWLPIISPTACQRNLTELIEVGDMVAKTPNHIPMYRTCLFGGDCQNVEGAYGALLTAKDVLIRTLEDLFNRGHIVSTADAVELAETLLYNNGQRIFN